MSVIFYTGRKALLRPKLLREIERVMQTDDDGEIIALVPEQLTLETELLTLRGLSLPGSFRLSVLSPARFCARVFDEVGRPSATVIDERGRAMLMGHALRTLNKRLKWYAGAKDKRGFEARAVAQIARLKQAGVSPEDLLSLSDAEPEGALKWKLHDLSILYAAYEEALTGRFQDGEDETEEALRRMPRAGFMKGARLFVFGFDLTTGIFNRMLACACGLCANTMVFLPLENDGCACDFSLYMPLQASYERMVREMTNAGVHWNREPLESPNAPDTACAHFAREAFCSPAAPFSGKNRSVQLAQLKNPLEEARFAAALIRRLVMKNHWRYSDILVLCADVQSYIDALESAFDAYEVPLFLAENRPADKRPLPRFLLETLKILSSGGGDLGALLLTGYTDLSDDEADVFLSYTLRYGLRSRDILKPLKRGTPEILSQMEPLRERLAAPMARLDAALSCAKTLNEQLAAIFLYLSDTNCAQKGEASRERLVEMNQRVLAAQDAQVWNRLMGALDQMSELMGESRLAKSQLTDLLTRAMSAEQIKPLPQSGDAVNAVSAARAGAVLVRAMIVVGQTANAAAVEDGLFARAELGHISEALDAFMGPDALSRVRTDRMYLKDALSMASDYLCVTYPMSGQDGSAVTPGPLVVEMRKIFPGLRARGGVEGDDGMLSMRYAAARAAENLAAVELSAGALSASGRAAIAAIANGGDASKDGLNRLRRALRQKTQSEEIGETLSRRVFGTLSKVSVTRLESFAKCPFAHFVKYALRPEKEEPFGLNARDEGGFYHEAVRAFLLSARDELSGMSKEEAARRMDGISDDILSGALREVVDDSGIARAQAKKLRRTAARAARTLARQLQGGEFTPVELEMEFGDAGASLRVNNDSDSARLVGRIDRVDAMTDGESRYLRVVDYKRGANKLDAGEMYYGLQLQLILYLAAALQKYGGKSAGAFYFRVDDPVISTESLDPEEIERERSDRLRMDGLLPADAELVRRMADEPERVFRLKFLKSGDLDARTNAATDAQFSLLIRHALACAARFTESIARGVTQIAPVQTASTDACAYCDYKGACMQDARIPGGKKKRLKKLTFSDVYEKLRPDD